MSYNRSEVMLSYVPEYYRESRLYNAQNAAKGQEIDTIRELLDEMLVQFAPQTATWSLYLWEELCGLAVSETEPDEDRRARIITKLATISPMTRELVRIVVLGATGARIETKSIGPYTESVEIIAAPPNTYCLISETIEEIKPAHLSFSYSTSVETYGSVLFATATQQHISYENTALEHSYKFGYDTVAFAHVGARPSQSIIMETQPVEVQRKMVEGSITTNIARRTGQGIVYENAVLARQAVVTYSNGIAALANPRPSQAINYESEEK